ncbi:low affinity immunoglobulin gamma Fc region receptor II [Etheostoma spectabile]|uniref:low affinity immunoglobulin gamma Fc region receptor II n=1 Tax=Etheostoma spectabile TaxID=54343 RepID=UPI0013AFD699|nr:low affinity immunoglobulin gamma Fc region receptor II-like [Etheostoma spectabile]
MEVPALCITLWMDVLMLLVAHIQHGYPQTPVSDAAFRIVPTRLQLFEYESVHFTCEGFNVSAGCRVRTIEESMSTRSNGSVTSTVTCTIDFAFPSDSGEYWCEAGGGQRSNTVNITVTAGSVVLESPALPVMEGDAVTLRCRTKMTPFSSRITNFYKDGRLVGSSPTGNLTIESVFKSHEGRYKCNIPGAGESPESRLAVIEEKYTGSVTHRADRTEMVSHQYYVLLWTAVSVVLFLQLLVIGLLSWKKHLVLLEVMLSDPNKDLYAVVQRDKKKKKDAADNLSLDTNRSTKPQTDKCKRAPQPLQSTTGPK